MKLNLSEDQNLTLKGSDKGGKLIDTTDYIQHCVLLFNNKELYEKLDANPKLSYAEKGKQKIDDILKHKYITDQEYTYLAENLESPRTTLFYGLPKIHKIIN